MTPTKSAAAAEYLVRNICAEMDWLGHANVTLQNDQEPALDNLAEAVRDKRTHGAVVRNSPRKGHS